MTTNRKIHPIVFAVENILKRKLESEAGYILAVSGGADSMALLVAASHLHKANPEAYSFTAVHVEHGLRGEESLHDMQLVTSYCETLGVPCIAERVDVKALVQDEHLSVEDAARRLRYGVLRRAKQELGARAILTAHHFDDQAETVLLKLLRGAGTDGLSAMRERSGEVWRPFLGAPRDMLRMYCDLQNVPYAEDATNSDVNYTRNRVRLQLLPYLEKNFNPEVRTALVRTATSLAQDADCLAQLAHEAYDKALVAVAAVDTDQRAQSITLDAGRINALPKALAWRVLREGYYHLAHRALAFERTQALAQLCEARVGGKVVQLPGVTACYTKGKIIFTLHDA